MTPLPLDSTIYQLRLRGWSVRCHYYRYSEDFPTGLRATHDMKWSSARKLRPLSCDGDVAVVRTKRRTFREQPTARGGKVEITLRWPAGFDETMGVAECSIKDPFVKKVGRDLALRRCIEKVNAIIAQTA